MSGRNKKFTASAPSNEPVEDLSQALVDALEANDANRVLELLDTAPRAIQKQPDIMMTRASILLVQGKDAEGLRILREIERKHPSYLEVLPALTTIYMEEIWPALALQSAKRALMNKDLSKENRAMMQRAVQEATQMLQEEASTLGISFETMRRASMFHENAQIAMNETNFSEVERLTKEAIKLAPNWVPPRNNRARSLFFQGKIAEAVTACEAVLASDPENIYALESLVTYHLVLEQPQQAREYVDRLIQLIPQLPPDGLEIEQVIMTLALVEDTPELLKMATRYLRAPADTLLSRSWYTFAVALIRSGNWKDASKLLKKAEKDSPFQMAQDLSNQLKARENKKSKSKLAWMPPPYPGTDLFLNPKVLEAYDALMETFSDPLAPFQQRNFQDFIQKYPYLFTAFKRFLWEENAHKTALDALEKLGTPEATEEILRFAFSQTGPIDMRIKVLLRMFNSGHYQGPKTVKIWDDERGTWNEVELGSQRVEDLEPNARPMTIALIDQANHAKNPEMAIALLRKAVKMEPTSPIAIFNLGVMLLQTGETEEGYDLIRQSVVVDPNYTYGHASIAYSEAQQGHVKEALEHLQIIERAEVISPNTLFTASLARILLAIRKSDLQTARQFFNTAAAINPDHSVIREFEKIIKEAENLKGLISPLFDYARQSSLRAHKKLLRTPLTENMSLRDCLGTNTKEMLIGVAGFWDTISIGKKAELVSRLAKVISDPKYLQETLEEDLEEKEREALQWMLEAGGIRPWEEFTQKYGDDSEESTLWNYHLPKSIPGRLRRSGLFYTGMLDKQQVSFIPVDLRLLLRKLLP